MLKQLALALALVAGAAHADSGLHTDLPLSYLEQTQGDARNQPLVIFLHGFGSNEEDLFGIIGSPRPMSLSTTARLMNCSAAPG